MANETTSVTTYKDGQMADTAMAGGITGKKVKIYIGELVESEGVKKIKYTSFCAGTTRALKISKSFSEEVSLHVGDSQDAPWTNVIPTGKSWSMNDEFALDRDFLASWQEAFFKDKPVVVKMVVTLPTQENTYLGWSYIEAFEINAENAQFIKAAINFKGTGELYLKTIDKKDPNPSELNINISGLQEA